MWESFAVYNTKPTKAHTPDTFRSWRRCLNFIHKPLDLFKKVDYIVSMNEEQKKLKQMREEAKEQRAQVAKLVKVVHKGINQSQFQVPQGPVNHNGQYTW